MSGVIINPLLVSMPMSAEMAQFSSSSPGITLPSVVAASEQRLDQLYNHAIMTGCEEPQAYATRLFAQGSQVCFARNEGSNGGSGRRIREPQELLQALRQGTPAIEDILEGYSYYGAHQDDDDHVTELNQVRILAEESLWRLTRHHPERISPEIVRTVLSDILTPTGYEHPIVESDYVGVEAFLPCLIASRIDRFFERIGDASAEFGSPNDYYQSMGAVAARWPKLGSHLVSEIRHYLYEVRNEDGVSRAVGALDVINQSRPDLIDSHTEASLSALPPNPKQRNRWVSKNSAHFIWLAVVRPELLRPKREMFPLVLQVLMNLDRAGSLQGSFFNHLESEIERSRLARLIYEILVSRMVDTEHQAAMLNRLALRQSVRDLESLFNRVLANIARASWR